MPLAQLNMRTRDDTSVPTVLFRPALDSHLLFMPLHRPGVQRRTGGRAILGAASVTDRPTPTAYSEVCKSWVWPLGTKIAVPHTAGTHPQSEAPSRAECMPHSQAARRSKSAPHMHVLVCICSDVRQFQSMLWTNIGSVFVAWPRTRGGGGGLLGSGRQLPHKLIVGRRPPGGGLVWFGSTPLRDAQTHSQRNRPCVTRLGWALPAVVVSRGAALLTAPKPHGGTRGREIPPCLCVWRAHCWGAFGSWGGGGVVCRLVLRELTGDSSSNCVLRLLAHCRLFVPRRWRERPNIKVYR